MNHCGKVNIYSSVTFVLSLNNCLKMYIALCACSRTQAHAVCVLVHMCCGGTCAGIRGQLLRVGSFLPLPGLWQCDSDYQACVASTSIN